MNLAEFLSELERLIRSLGRKKDRVVESTEDRNRLRAVIDTWLYDVRHELPQNMPPENEKQLAQLDSIMQQMLEATYHRTSARRYVGLLDEFRQGAVRLRVDTVKATRVSLSSTANSGSKVVLETLERLNPAIADSYAQALRDLADATRVSLRGTANQLREVLREVLEVLSPDEFVIKAPWYNPKDENGRPKPRPTYADRTKYALVLKGKGKNAQNQTATSVVRTDELLGSMVRSTYDRASGAVHTEVERKEIVTQLRFINAILLELLGE